MVSLGSLWGSLLPVAGNLRKTLIWVFCVIVAGGLLGAISGYAVGFQTAQLIYDTVASLGMIIFGIILVAVVILIIFALLSHATSSGQSSSRRRRRRY